MTQQVKVASKPDGLSSVTETHMIEVGTTCRKLFSDSTLYDLTYCIHGVHTHRQIN